MGEMAIFNPDSMADQLRAKIKLEAMNIISEEQWSALIKQTLVNFTERRRNRQNNEEIPSQLEDMVTDCIKEIFRPKVISMLNSSEFMQLTWNSEGMHVVEGKIRDMAIKMAPVILNDMVAGIAKTAVDSFISQAQRNRSGY